MSKELTVSEQIELADRYAQSTIIAEAYRKKPADILVAIALGQSIGISAVQSLSQINVINGKPTMSAELIAGRVRNAGHKLRIEVEETPGKECAICTIIRRDDPEHPFVSKRDRAWAQRMGLIGKSNYIKQPATMLKKRAITDCARDACSEVLCGIAYCEEEMSDFDEVKATVEDESGTVGSTQNPEIVEAEIVNEHKPQSTSKQSNTNKATKEQGEQILAMLEEAGITDRALAINYVKHVLMENPSGKLTKSEAEEILAHREDVIQVAREWMREHHTKRAQETTNPEGEKQ